ncbi:MAG: hypothetical protein A2W01_06550, partial [Candidatus Solincola sediminis]
MRKIISLALAILILVPIAAGCTNKSSPPLETDESEDLVLSNEPVMDPVDMNNQVGFDFALFRSIVSEDQNKNVVLSPISAKIALVMAYNGASGEAKEAMAKVLQLEGLDLDQIDTTYHDLIASLEHADPKVELEIANSLWANNVDFLPDFLARCRGYFDASLDEGDFCDPHTIEAINAWVSEKTKGKIGKIVEKLTREDLFILLNAVYFSGKWQKAFDPEETTDQDFRLTDGSTKKVPTMRRKAEFPYFENEDFQAVRLPYGDGRLGMSILLPKEGKDLNALIENINIRDWSLWMNSLKNREGHVGMPRFKVEYSKELSDSLISIGMRQAFEINPELEDSAFGGMAAMDGLVMKRVIQKTHIDVNEEGTEAAAVTGFVIGVASVPPDDSFIMNIDRPFLFAITDSATQAILFM